MRAGDAPLEIGHPPKTTAAATAAREAATKPGWDAFTFPQLPEAHVWDPDTSATVTDRSVLLFQVPPRASQHPSIAFSSAHMKPVIRRKLGPGVASAFALRRGAQQLQFAYSAASLASSISPHGARCCRSLPATDAPASWFEASTGTAALRSAAPKYPARAQTHAKEGARSSSHPPPNPRGS